MVKLHVQWTKEKYEVDYDPSIGFDGFQALLFSLTNVPIERQKVMIKSKMAKDASVLDTLKEGDKVVLMGSADAAPQAPTKKIVFEEDLTDAQKIGVVKDVLSAGLHNMGNTCYLASTLQCLRAVPELKTALVNKANGVQPQQHDANNAVVRELGRLYQQMDKTSQPVTPMMFTSIFRSTFPQFAETNNEGHWMQQDAEEALLQLMGAMANILKTTDASSSSSSLSSGSAGNTIDDYFSIKAETRMVPVGVDANDASAKVEQQNLRRLQCFIDSETNFLFQGIRLSLNEPLELRGQLYNRTTTITSLPRYLIVQMMRFDWRKDTQKKSKKLRKVDYPLKLDLAEFCHPTLKHQLTQARNLIKEEQDIKLGLPTLKKGPTASPSPPPAAAASSSSSTAAASADASNPWAADSGAAMDVDSGAGAPATASDLKLTTPTSGCYELFGVVTHKGRDSDSGHYVSWTKQPDGRWMNFDDDVVTYVENEDKVKGLSGGGDWHMAYLLFYRRIDDSVKFLGQSIPQPQQQTAKEIAEAAKKGAAAAASSSSAAPPAAASK